MWLYTCKSQFVSVTKKSGHQRRDYKRGLLYQLALQSPLYHRSNSKSCICHVHNCTINFQAFSWIISFNIYNYVLRKHEMQSTKRQREHGWIFFLKLTTYMYTCMIETTWNDVKQHWYTIVQRPSKPYTMLHVQN
jgi:hypothetical protein